MYNSKFCESYYNLYSIYGFLFIKMIICYFNESLLNANTIGDNLASHNIQQVMIYNTNQHIEVFWVFICYYDFYKFLHQNHNLQSCRFDQNQKDLIIIPSSFTIFFEHIK
jgi:hypothetical protein